MTVSFLLHSCSCFSWLACRYRFSEAHSQHWCLWQRRGNIDHVGSTRSTSSKLRNELNPPHPKHTGGLGSRTREAASASSASASSAASSASEHIGSTSSPSRVKRDVWRRGGNFQCVCVKLREFVSDTFLCLQSNSPIHKTLICSRLLEK